jgi:hypothetical protein
MNFGAGLPKQAQPTQVREYASLFYQVNKNILQ